MKNNRVLKADSSRQFWIWKLPRRTPWMVLLGLLLCISSVDGQELPVENGFAARIDGTVITLAELDRAVHRQITSARGQIHESLIEQETARLLPIVLRSLIERQLLLQRAIHEKIVLPPEAVESYLQDTVDRLSRAEGTRYSIDDYLALWEQQFGEGEMDLRTRLGEELRIDELRRRKIRSTRSISPKKLREYYKSHQAEFTGESHISFRQLLIAMDDPDSSRIREESSRALEAGDDFEELVKKWSMGPRRDIGGLYRMTDSELDARFPPVPEVVRGLKPGDTSDWFICRGYIHKILMVERAEGVPLDFARAQDQIRTILTRDLEQKKRKQFEESLWREANVEVFIPGVSLPTT
ncbi:MAG: SurA N-terminal domain-containing protein [Planctomycetota bacterium]|nr:SurA N-terminal domain-containing protein [Planctomycetota bacterium]